jgi:precorrin-6A/cobalt-precorrin-6A reductase
VPSWCELLLDRGPYELSAELELLRSRRIDVLVTKNSGGEMTAAKLTAARELGIPVVLIERPPLPAGVAVVQTAGEVQAWLTGGSAGARAAGRLSFHGDPDRTEHPVR